MLNSHLKAAIDITGQFIPEMPRLEERDRDPSPPLILTGDEDIAAIRDLVHAGQATAVMQVVVDPRGGMPQPGVVVSEFTPSGWMAFEAHLSKKKT